MFLVNSWPPKRIGKPLKAKILRRPRKVYNTIRTILPDGSIEDRRVNSVRIISPQGDTSIVRETYSPELNQVEITSYGKNKVNNEQYDMINKWIDEGLIKRNGGRIEKAGPGRKLSQRRIIKDENNGINHEWNRWIAPGDTTMSYSNGSYTETWNSKKLPNGKLSRTRVMSYPDGRKDIPTEWLPAQEYQWNKQNQIFDKMLPVRDTMIVDYNTPPMRRKGGRIGKDGQELYSNTPSITPVGEVTQGRFPKIGFGSGRNVISFKSEDGLIHNWSRHDDGTYIWRGSPSRVSYIYSPKQTEVKRKRDGFAHTTIYLPIDPELMKKVDALIDDNTKWWQ